MKRSLAMILVLALVFCLTGCGKNNEKKELIEKAVEELESQWEEIYDDVEKTDGYFEIKNTRVITLKKTDIEEFEEIEYIVEFVLFTDYFGAAPYYSSVGLSDSVVVYEDGEMEVRGQNPLHVYSSRNYSYDYSDIVEEVEDFGEQYNCIKEFD